MRLHHPIISTRERPRPRGSWPQPLEILQNLARQGQQRPHGFAPPHPKRNEQLRGRFLHREHMTGGHHGRCVIQEFLASRDRKSTRLNSSHLGISYAVFCLKKKKKKIT